MNFRFAYVTKREHNAFSACQFEKLAKIIIKFPSIKNRLDQDDCEKFANLNYNIIDTLVTIKYFGAHFESIQLEQCSAH
jgi:enolase